MKNYVLFTLSLFLGAFLTSNAQNCGVSILTINVVDATTYPNFDILVSGSAIGNSCNQIKVRLFCSTIPGGVSEKIVDVSANGSWSAKFDDYLCRCANEIYKISVAANCVGDENCSDSKSGLEIKCPTGTSICCNVINVTTSQGVCVDDVSGCKKRNIKFVPTVNGNCDGFNWNFGDGSDDVSGVGLPTSIERNYFHCPQTAPKLTTFKAGCVPSTFTIGLSCNDCIECPISNSINLNQLTSNNCTLSGIVIADICEEQYVNFVIDYGDDTSETIDINQLNGLQVNHNYASNGTFPFKIILQKNGSNCPYSKTITISNCGVPPTCPEGQHYDTSQQKCVSNDDGSSSCLFCFCSNGFWCCLGFIFLILLMVSTLYFLLAAICGGGAWNWAAFTAGLLLVVGLAYLLVESCGVTACQILLAIASSGILADWIVCPNIPCTAFLCGTFEVPILGVKIKNIFLISVLLFVLSLIFDCG